MGERRVQPKNALRHLIRLRREGLGILHEPKFDSLAAAFWAERLMNYVEKLFPEERDQFFPREPLPALEMEDFTKGVQPIDPAVAEANHKVGIEGRLRSLELVIKRISAFVHPQS
jgi:hypothetical protein